MLLQREATRFLAQSSSNHTEQQLLARHALVHKQTFERGRKRTRSAFHWQRQKQAVKRSSFAGTVSRSRSMKRHSPRDERSAQASREATIASVGRNTSNSRQSEFKPPASEQQDKSRADRLECK